MMAQAVAESNQPLDPLWIDARSNEAFQARNARASDPLAREVAAALRNDGVAIIKKLHMREQCADVINAYQRFLDERGGLKAGETDESGREKRLVNFHLYSDQLLNMLLNRRLLNILDHVFGSKTSLYTTLTFKYGSQQPVHRDTPHFSTWPDSYFVGVWTALEDVRESAGPLFYYKGAHKLAIDHSDFVKRARAADPNGPADKLAAVALDLYNGAVIDSAPTAGLLSKALVEAGDVLIWHAQTPHGGLPAKDLNLTRWSVVAHYAPESIAVNQHAAFFLHEGTDQPARWYAFKDVGGRKVALSGVPGFM